MAKRRPTPKPPRRTRARMPAKTEVPKSHDHGNHDEGHADHDDQGPRGEGTVSVGIRVRITVPDDVRGKDLIALYLFDEDEQPLCHCQVDGESARVDLPRRLIGHLITVVAAPVAAGRKEPTLDALRAREAGVIRAPFDAGRRWISASSSSRPPLQALVLSRARPGRAPHPVAQRANHHEATLQCTGRDLRSRRQPQADHLPAVGRSGPIAGCRRGRYPSRPAPTAVRRDSCSRTRGPGDWTSHSRRTPARHGRSRVRCGRCARACGRCRLREGLPRRQHRDPQSALVPVRRALSLVRRRLHQDRTDRSRRRLRHRHFVFLLRRSSRSLLQGRTAMWRHVDGRPRAERRLQHALGLLLRRRGRDRRYQRRLLGWGRRSHRACRARRAIRRRSDSGRCCRTPRRCSSCTPPLMRTGKVLMFSGGVENQLPKESRVWDAATGSFVAHTFGDDLFCAYQVVLADGRVLVMGGSNYQGPHGQGVNDHVHVRSGRARLGEARRHGVRALVSDCCRARRWPRPRLVRPGRRPGRRTDGAIRSGFEYVDDAAGEREQAAGHLPQPAPDGGREGPVHRHALGGRQQLASTVAIAAGFGALRSGDEYLGQCRGARDSQPYRRHVGAPAAAGERRAPSRPWRGDAAAGHALAECSSSEATADRLLNA